jgi:hypothetical protein
MGTSSKRDRVYSAAAVLFAAQFTLVLIAARNKTVWPAASRWLPSTPRPGMS